MFSSLHLISYFKILFQILRETKTMKETQARTSVETAREVNNDKSLKNKAEKDRILKEKHCNMTK